MTETQIDSPALTHIRGRDSRPEASKMTAQSKEAESGPDAAGGISSLVHLTVRR